MKDEGRVCTLFHW